MQSIKTGVNSRSRLRAGNYAVQNALLTLSFFLVLRIAKSLLCSFLPEQSQPLSPYFEPGAFVPLHKKSRLRRLMEACSGSEQLVSFFNLKNILVYINPSLIKLSASPLKRESEKKLTWTHRPALPALRYFSAGLNQCGFKDWNRRRLAPSYHWIASSCACEYSSPSAVIWSLSFCRFPVS